MCRAIAKTAEFNLARLVIQSRLVASCMSIRPEGREAESRKRWTEGHFVESPSRSNFW
jgi:hypothetical protein